VQVSDGSITDARRKKGGSASWVYLPAGEVMVTPVPGTATGTVVFDRVPMEDVEVLGLKLTFKAGKIVAMTAKPGAAWDRLKAYYDKSPPRKDEFGTIDIGVNPSVKVPKGSKLLSYIQPGIVNVWAGGNVDSGGDNPVNANFGGALIDATVTVDGVTLVEKGSLKVDPATAR
jgi:hypothetical protein